MQCESQNILNFIMLIAISICFAIGTIFYSSVFLVYYFVFLFTIVLFRFLNRNTIDFNNTTTIFIISLFFGFILAFANNAYYLQNNITFSSPDQMSFFAEAKMLALSSDSINDVIKLAFSGIYLDYWFVYALFGLLGFIDKITSGSVNFLPLLYSVVYLTSFISVFLYHIIKLYVPKTIAFKSSLFYAVFTPVMGLSAYLLRDMHVALIIIIALFTIVGEVKMWRIMLLFMLMLLVYGMRIANSLLILAMIGIYIFTGKSSKLMRFSAIIIGIVLLVYFSNDIVRTIISTSNRIESYETYSDSKLQEREGLGAYIYKLPPVIKQVTIVVFAFSAFPFVKGIPEINSLSDGIMTFYTFITNFGWFIVFFYVLVFFKRIIVSTKEMKIKLLFFLLILFVLYLFMNVSNMNFRRLVCVFPFIYIPVIITYNALNKSKRKKVVFKAFIAAGGLYIVYFILLLIK